MADEKIGEVFGHGGDDVGAFDYGQQAHEVRKLDDHAALQALVLHVTLEHVLAPVGVHHGMRGFHELSRAHARADGAVLATQQADVGGAKQALLEKARAVQVRKVTDGQFGCAGLQTGCSRVPGHGQRLERDAGRRARELREQARQEIHLGNVGREQREAARAGLRIEYFGREDLPLDALDDLVHGSPQLLGARCGLHLRTRAHEQGVAEDRAQAGEGGAHGRLAQAQGLTGPRDVAVLLHGLEHQQQVQVDFFTIHGVDFVYLKN